MHVGGAVGEADDDEGATALHGDEVDLAHHAAAPLANEADGDAADQLAEHADRGAHALGALDDLAEGNMTARRTSARSSGGAERAHVEAHAGGGGQAPGGVVRLLQQAVLLDAASSSEIVAAEHSRCWVRLADATGQPVTM